MPNNNHFTHAIYCCSCNSFIATILNLNAIVIIHFHTVLSISIITAKEHIADTCTDILHINSNRPALVFQHRLHASVNSSSTIKIQMSCENMRFYIRELRQIAHLNRNIIFCFNEFPDSISIFCGLTESAQTINLCFIHVFQKRISRRIFTANPVSVYVHITVDATSRLVPIVKQIINKAVFHIRPCRKVVRINSFFIIFNCNRCKRLSAHIREPVYGILTRSRSIYSNDCHITRNSSERFIPRIIGEVFCFS